MEGNEQESSPLLKKAKKSRDGTAVPTSAPFADRILRNFSWMSVAFGNDSIIILKTSTLTRRVFSQESPIVAS